MAGKQYSIDMIVKAISEGFDTVARDLSKINETAGKGGTQWTELRSAVDLAVGGLRQVKQYAGQAWDALKDAAELDKTNQRFDRLAASIGTTGDALREDLHNAIGGLMSDAQQVGLASDLMSLGLAKTQEEAVRLSNVAGQLGMNIGQMVLTLTNQTTMRFDSLGLMVDGFDEKLEMLEGQGLSTDEAFKWAFIEQAEDQIERVGSVADTAAGKLLTLENKYNDLVNRVKQDALEAAEPGIESATVALSKKDAVAVLREELDKLDLSWLKLVATENAVTKDWTGILALMEDADVITRRTAIAVALLNSGWEGSERALEALIDKLDNTNQTIRDGWQAANNYAYGLDNMGASARYARGEIEDLGTSISELARLGGIKAILDDAERPWAATHEFDYLNMELNEAAERTKDLNAAAEDGEDKIGGYGVAAETAAEKLARLNQETASLFQQARGMKEYKPGEELLRQLERGGGNALMLARAGVSAGLFSQDEANTYLGRAASMQQERMIAQGIISGKITAEQAGQLMEQFRTGIEENQGLAEEFFSDIVDEPKTAMVDADLSVAYSQTDAFAAYVAGPWTMTINPVVEGDGEEVSNIYDSLERNGGV